MSVVKFRFRPMNPEKGEHIVEKSDGGMKHRYLRGISSGVKVDGHGEKMTEKCIKSFSEQAKSGDILLYADRHDVNYTDDIGLLCDHDILPNNDWMTEYRLYDESDDVGTNTIERSSKLWKQINGLPPYTRPRQKGFSVEGSLDREKDIIKYGSGGERVMNNVVLDGVVVVPRPAYEDSVANAVYKALEEMPPWQVDKKVQKMFDPNQVVGQDFYIDRFKLEDSLYSAIEVCMNEGESENLDKYLDGIFENHKRCMKSLIQKTKFTKNEDLFIDKDVYKRELFDKLNVVMKSLQSSFTNKQLIQMGIKNVN